MISVVPILGHHALQTPPLLEKRICGLIKNLGHEPSLIDEGSIITLHEADPLRILVPFTLSVKDSLPEEIVQDWLTPIRLTFPSALHMEDTAQFIPITLGKRSNELVLNGDILAPSLVTQTLRFAFRKLSDANLELPGICEAIGATKSKLESEFIKWGKPDAWKAIRQLRMDVAADLLAETRRPIYEIALAVGYSDLPSFDTSFHAVKEMSPRDFRQKHNSANQNGNKIIQIQNTLSRIVS